MDKKRKKPVAEKVTEGHVYVEKTITKNIGDHNFAKVTVGVQVPIDPTEEDLAAAANTIAVAVEVVDEALEIELERLLED